MTNRVRVLCTICEQSSVFKNIMAHETEMFCKHCDADMPLLELGVYLELV